MQLTSTFVLAAVLAFKASSVLALPFEITEVASVGARDISVLDAEVEARAFDDEFEIDAREFDDEFEIDAREFDDEFELEARDFDDFEEFDARAILPKVAAKAVTSAVRKTSTPAGTLSKTPVSSAGHLNKEVNHDSASRKTGLTGARTSAQRGTSGSRSQAGLHKTLIGTGHGVTGHGRVAGSSSREKEGSRAGSRRPGSREGSQRAALQGAEKKLHGEERKDRKLEQELHRDQKLLRGSGSRASSRAAGSRKASQRTALQGAEKKLHGEERKDRKLEQELHRDQRLLRGSGSHAGSRTAGREGSQRAAFQGVEKNLHSEERKDRKLEQELHRDQQLLRGSGSSRV